MIGKPIQDKQVNNKFEKDESAKAKMLRGSAWMTMGSIFSRILGAIYIIPWYAWFGKDNLAANYLYTQGYTVYSVFLMISIAGIPSAVSKQVAHYNAKNEYALGQRLYKKLVLLMLGLGIGAALIMWLIAPLISQGDPKVVPVYRSLAIALTIIPLMSLTRGFFQGYQDMFPSALSQLLEQVARVCYMLAATYLIMRVLKGSYVTGVVHSTFAAFIGALGGLTFLGFFYLKKKKRLNELAAQSANQLDISDGQVIKDLLVESVPFIIIGVSTTLYNLLDQFTFKKIMLFSTNFSVKMINDLYAIFAGNANKLIMITISLAAAMAATVIPLLSEAYTKKDQKQISAQITDAVELFLLLMLPCSLGMAAVAKPLYVVFYQYDITGIYVLSFSAYVAIPIGLFMVLSSLLQGIYQNKLAIRYFVIGIIIKIILQVPLTMLLHPFGPLLATAAGMMVSNWLMLRCFYYSYQLDLNRVTRRFDALLLFSLVTFVVALGTVQVSSLFLNLQYRIQAMLSLLMSVGTGGFCYVYLCLKTRMADKILGARASGLRRLLRIR
ncbi:putative polysaccharide biosynthesis protein [Liquorilactobacillus oeni]|uniref:Export protein n=1 Tax=Liquorilactobacillus oeni DSM 19972 TaxID=1423777 RepID=A0A0R1MIF7_9LACO|nr:polysaccharide biosynthesis protein [Liquorilactobacillus oeni]KRL04938.1 export protein [Liquorilactobacillus oeni DSM 19972]